MNSLQKTLDQLLFDEGSRNMPYHDTATPPRLTIGVGRNLDDNGLSDDEVQYLFKNDVDRVIQELVNVDEAEIGQNCESFFIDQPEAIQNVLINMAFNLGTEGLLKFKKTLALIGQRRYSMASEEMLRSRWADQVGVRAERLSKVVFECSPDAPSGDLHRAMDATDPVPSGYKVKIFTDHNESRLEIVMNEWFDSVGEIVISNIWQSERSTGARTLTILYRFKDES